MRLPDSNIQSCANYDPIYACDQGGGVGGPSSDYVCWQCDTGYHWDTSAEDCVSDCSVPTCEVDCTTASECATVDNGPKLLGGCYWEEGVINPPPSQTGVCCPDLQLWNPVLRTCRDFNPCYPSPCIFDPDPFPPIDPAWWTFTPECIDDNAGDDWACCAVEEFGGPTYDYVYHVSY